MPARVCLFQLDSVRLPAEQSNSDFELDSFSRRYCSSCLAPRCPPTLERAICACRLAAAANKATHPDRRMTCVKAAIPLDDGSVHARPPLKDRGVGNCTDTVRETAETAHHDYCSLLVQCEQHSFKITAIGHVESQCRCHRQHGRQCVLK